MLITEGYAALNRQLHADRADYGSNGHRNREAVRGISDYGRLSILDYGCGKGTLAQYLGPAYRVTNYDPAFPEFSATPGEHDVVVCFDMLEHVEPECLAAVLADIRRCTGKRVVMSIHTGPAIKTLPDGRNTHLIQKPAQWWAETLERAGFYIVELTVQGDHVVVHARRAEQ